MTLIPPQYKLAAYGLLLAGIATAVGAWHIHAVDIAKEDGTKAGRKEVQAEWDKERAKQAQDLLEHNAAVREEEKRRTIAQEQIDRDNQARIAKAQSDAASASSALERLRLALKTPSSTPSKRLPGDPIPTFVCTAEPETRDALRDCASRYLEMGKRATKAGTEGLACEHAYDSLQVRP